MSPVGSGTGQARGNSFVGGAEVFEVGGDDHHGASFGGSVDDVGGGHKGVMVDRHETHHCVVVLFRQCFDGGLRRR